MSETASNPIKPNKRFVKETIIAKTEITGGTWDENSNTYSLIDKDSGITTEYRLRKIGGLTNELGGSIHTFKDMPDPTTGEMKPTEVVYDAKNEAWVRRGPVKKALGNIQAVALRTNVQFMATLSRVKNQETSTDTYSLLIEPVKFKKSNIDYAIPIGDTPLVLRSGYSKTPS